MSEQVRTAFDYDDARQIIDELDEIKERHREGVAALNAEKKREEAAVMKRAEQLGFPKAVLKQRIAIRADQLKIIEKQRKVPERYLELFEDLTRATPVAPLPLFDGIDAVAEAAARQAIEEADRRHEEEQREGERVLEELASVRH